MASKNLVTANAVVVAKTFNVSIFTQMWLVRSGIFEENEFVADECASLPVLSQVGTATCNLLVVPERLQLTMKAPSASPREFERIRKIVGLLPQTPYDALGLNILWDVIPSESEGVGNFTHGRFAVPLTPLRDAFAASDARFGAYLSRDFEGFRLKLDIKPVTVATPTSTGELVRLSFNFHLDLGAVPDRTGRISSGLDKWQAVFGESERIADMVVNGNP